MAETEPIPAGLELPEHFSLPDFSTLTPEQQEAINTGPGWVNEHVDVVKFDDDKPFTPHIGVYEGGCGNFIALLGQEGIYEFVAGKMPTVQRYLILFPKQAEELRKQIEGQSILSLPESTLHQARKAYKILAELIDSSDAYLTGDPASDKMYLVK